MDSMQKTPHRLVATKFMQSVRTRPGITPDTAVVRGVDMHLDGVPAAGYRLVVHASDGATELHVDGVQVPEPWQVWVDGDLIAQHDWDGGPVVRRVINPGLAES